MPAPAPTIAGTTNAATLEPSRMDAIEMPRPAPDARIGGWRTPLHTPFSADRGRRRSPFDPREAEPALRVQRPMRQIALSLALLTLTQHAEAARATVTLDLVTRGARVVLTSGADQRDVPTFPIRINVDTSQSWTIEATKPGFR